MTKKIYDIGIVGSGVAGVFAAMRLAENHKNKKCILFELGRPPQKRRRPLEGYFGSFTFGDGKLYLNDTEQLQGVVDGRRLKSMSKWVQEQFNNIHTAKIIKNKLPSVNFQKKIKEHGFNIKLHDYQQWTPEHIHNLSRNTAERIENAPNIEFSFDNEVFSILKKENSFVISSNDGDYHCKKVLLCVGRSGWRWVNDLYRKFEILTSDDIVTYGVKIELSAQYLKELNKSHLSLISDDMILGPFSWNGSIIQEDHANYTSAAFRSNEDRWKSDKVFFSMYINSTHPGNACKQTERLAKLAFVLSNDRVGREKIVTFLKSDIENELSLVPEYFELKKHIEKLNELIPTVISRGYMHVPDIYSITSNINVAPNLETEIDGLFVAGESAGFRGINSAAISGAIAAECIAK